ncbi:2-oxoacid:acceptor oxidoreductase subunit alpha [Desulfohalobium retbaense]|uniref:Pyruvate flavodoxin/ferredoxin oxidoreductase domain protein n=1 Tax=Desulfohalobium retbaense (strain ATCC 49708 / DSM 5692 / JCM 16813 / HR100) TaxID=485915 RepID=C8X0I7_DESRD|nr:2-oxoacid:acceptor oxidoreductase subunit alpha [Desulfohalobium retbaense]ACV67812.1 pyruvate flavodoxin/ferredoxin oxidoreductase domain protein [Desulfohalobium retbaense DSM 5692]
MHDHDPSVQICIGGEAGQGLVTIGHLLSKALVRDGYWILVSQSYMSRIRGGHNTFSIRVGTEPVLSPREDCDVLVALNQDTIEQDGPALTTGGCLVGDTDLDFGELPHLAVPTSDLASKPLYANTAALGVVGGLLGVRPQTLEALLREQFAKKKEEVITSNLGVLEAALSWVEENRGDFPPLPAAQPPESSLMLNGSEAVALGALAGGVRFCSFYPMTPATGVALNLIAQAEAMGVVTEQAEDEIAAVNMALGASYAGSRVLVPTSGGGYALMTEGVSLAGMHELPLVLVVAQRPGPATGLPTQTEQGDLEFVLFGGHGEFPRAVFAPGDIPECFHLTRKSMGLAERWQSPVFVLSDQYLADAWQTVSAPELEYEADPPSDSACAQVAADSYERYAVTESGVSPRCLPGQSEALVVNDSDEHTPDGHITEDHAVRVAMVDKRLRKREGLKQEVTPPTYTGDPLESGMLLICWGSSKGPVLEAATLLRQAGQRVGVLHFSQVWPLVPETFPVDPAKAQSVVVVEGNATGQFAALLRREMGIEVSGKVLRYDGLPLTAAFIWNQLAEAGMIESGA